MTAYQKREDHFDGDDTAKWSGEAERQMRLLPLGTERNVSHPLVKSWLEDRQIQGTAVDFGCGTAFYRTLFSGMRYIGIDQNPDMIAASKARWPGPDETFYQVPLNKILDNHPELENAVDAGLFLTVLQHNHHETADEIMEQVKRMLKPGALLFVMEATYVEEFYPSKTRQQLGLPDPDPERLDSMVYGAAIYTVKGWAHFLDRFGFDYFYDGAGAHIGIKR